MSCFACVLLFWSAAIWDAVDTGGVFIAVVNHPATERLIEEHLLTPCLDLPSARPTSCSVGWVSSSGEHNDSIDLLSDGKGQINGGRPMPLTYPKERSNVIKLLTRIEIRHRFIHTQFEMNLRHVLNGLFNLYLKYFYIFN